MDSGSGPKIFVGIQDGIAVLTNALLRSYLGVPIDGIRPVVRIPLRNINFIYKI